MVNTNPIVCGKHRAAIEGAPCRRDTVFQISGDGSLSEDGILEYLRDLGALLGRIPTQSFGEGLTDFVDILPEDRLALFRLLRTKPTTGRVKAAFGSWLNALIQAGVLEDGTRKSSRGIQTIARDGHVCLLLGEKTIDDLLFSHGIRYEKDPCHPEGNFRGDFRVGEVLIEYFGLAGNPDYDAQSREKTRICKKYGIVLIATYPEDLVSVKRLEGKLQSISSMSQ